MLYKLNDLQDTVPHVHEMSYIHHSKAHPSGENIGTLLPGYWSIKLVINFLFVLVISLHRQEIWICLGDICTIRGDTVHGEAGKKEMLVILFISFASKLWFTMTTISFPAKLLPHQCSPGSLQIFVNPLGMSSPTLSSVAIKWYKCKYSNAFSVTEIKLNFLNSKFSINSSPFPFFVHNQYLLIYSHLGKLLQNFL